MQGLSVTKGCRKFKYSICGRKPWKVSKEVEQFVVRKLKELRKKCVCTSTTLQEVLAKEMHVELECSHKLSRLWWSQ